MPASNTFPLTLSGIASDPEGRPIAGARVYLASRRADYKRLAETTTDAGGRYEFRDVPLPIEKADTFTGQDFGVFQVFAEAKGFGFAWRIEKWFYPRPVPPTYDVSNLYQAGDKIRLDLEFTVAARLAGTIVDDRGKPLPDIRLEIRDCETGILGEGKPLLPFATLNERNSAPASMKIRTTDAEGRFEFLDLPADCRFRISVSGQGFPIRWIYAATTDGLQPEYDGVPVLTGDINLTLATPLDIPIKLVFADNGRPAPDVAVQAVEGYVSDFKSSDAEGLATLRLPRGKYRMEDWPARGTPYLVTEAELVVGDAPPAEPIVRTLRPAAILEITVVDESTGEGLPDVDLWREVNGQRDRIVVRSWEVATRIARRDSPRTDARGKVRVFIEPGKHLVGIGLNALPGGYGDIDVEGREVDCREGQTTSLKFSLRKHVK